MRISDWSSDVCSSDLQKITPALQVAFTERFGPVEPHPLGSRRGLDDHPQVMVLENRSGKRGPRNDFWHSDISFGEKPPLGSMLYAMEITEGRSDTMFCNMYAAYEGLSDGLKKVLDGLTAMHSAELLVREEIGRASLGKECVSTCRSRWSPDN